MNRVIQCCRELAQFTEEPGRITRRFLSPSMRDVHRLLGDWMRRIGMEVWIDAAGNLRGLLGDAHAPRLLIGSHLDTVPNAGAFDGILGVVMGIALAESQPGIAVEVVGFSEEEGVRFGLPFIGSRAVVGTLDDEVLNRRDEDGISVRDAIENFGLDPEMLPQAGFAAATSAYLEIHIEQGPVLENLDLPVAVVDAIAGQSRFMVTFEGKANHAGTTPMSLRDDALVRAAEWILLVNRTARDTPGLVATVGSVSVSPNAGNVIPGEVRASLDVRHASDAVRLNAVQSLLPDRREELLNQAAVPLKTDLWDPSLHRMTSGAGHDAMIMASYLPSYMLFVRSPGGISHHPDETVLPEDVDAALTAGAEFMRAFKARYV